MTDHTITRELHVTLGGRDDELYPFELDITCALYRADGEIEAEVVSLETVEYNTVKRGHKASSPAGRRRISLDAQWLLNILPTAILDQWAADAAEDAPHPAELAADHYHDRRKDDQL